MTTLTKVLLIALLAWNLIVFLLYGIDKAKAKKGSRRVPEKTLLWCAFLLGGAGGMAGMLVFRHKTRHTRFRVLLPVALILTLAAMGVYVYFFVKQGGAQPIWIGRAPALSGGCSGYGPTATHPF